MRSKIWRKFRPKNRTKEKSVIDAAAQNLCVGVLILLNRYQTFNPKSIFYNIHSKNDEIFEPQQFSKSDSVIDAFSSKIEITRWASEEKEKTLILYPGPDAVPLNEIQPRYDYNILVIDGTWNQAKSMYINSPELHDLKKVEVNTGRPSTYVIRTQPFEGCLSTCETVAIALSHVERNQSIYDTLVRPLDALCQFQLGYGASKHHSREYLVRHGLFDKPVPKDLRRKLKGVVQFDENHMIVNGHHEGPNTDGQVDKDTQEQKV